MLPSGSCSHQSLQGSEAMQLQSAFDPLQPGGKGAQSYSSGHPPISEISTKQ